MSDFNLDWDTALKADEAMGDGGFAPIPDGTYTVQCKEAEAKTFSSGNVGIKMKMAVVGGPYNGRFLWTNLVWATSNEQSLGMFVKKCVAFGLTREWLSTGAPSLQTTANELVGRMAEAKVVTSEYQGKKSNDVKNLSPLSSAPTAAPPMAPGPGAAPVGTMAPPAPPAPPITAAAPAAPAAPPLPPVVPEVTPEQAGFPGTQPPAPEPAAAPATPPPAPPQAEGAHGTTELDEEPF